jgi:hypothetical protein
VVGQPAVVIVMDPYAGLLHQQVVLERQGRQWRTEEVSWLLQLAHALVSLQSKRIAHRDLKVCNPMV